MGFIYCDRGSFSSPLLHNKAPWNLVAWNNNNLLIFTIGAFIAPKLPYCGFVKKVSWSHLSSIMQLHLADGSPAPSCGLSSRASLLFGSLRTAFQEGKPQCTSASQLVLTSSLLISHWPSQVTGSSPESVYKGDTQGHGHWEMWFSGGHYCNIETPLLSGGPKGVLRVLFVPFVR